MISPLGYRVMIEPIDFEKKYQGMIHIPEQITERQRAGTQEGIVVALGPSAYIEHAGGAWCKEGDHVLFAKYGGLRVTDPDTEQEFILVNDDDVICAVTEVKDSE